MRYKKLILTIFTLVAFWLLQIHQAFAGGNIFVYVDDKQVEFDARPIIETSSNRTLVPFRQIFEALGAEVWYDNNVKSAFGHKGDLTIELPVNQKVAYKNNSKIQLDVATQVVNGRTMVPLRFIGESLGCRVDARNIPAGLRVDIAWMDSGQPDNFRSLEEIKTTANDLELVLELKVEDGENKIFQLGNPDRLVIDLRNTTNRASEMIKLDDPVVSSIRTGQMDSTTRVVLDLNDEINYRVEKSEGSLIIKINHPAVEPGEGDAGPSGPGGQAGPGEAGEPGLPGGLDEKTEPVDPAGQSGPPAPEVDDNLIILDPGHGGKDVGAIGYSGKYEKDLVFNITSQLKTALENEGYNVILTRTDDSYVSLEERVNIADRTNAFAFISIHANSATNSAVEGVEVFKFYGSDPRLAQNVLNSILRQTGQVNRKVKEAGFYVIKNTLMPAILIETGFISNPREEAFLWDPQNQEAIVRGIVNGIMDYQGR
ncbi:N-acetylmuramoyl-L-alanine amidase [Desulfallas thermosapovorans DSM 6562]|uniref:N-acetylmuramoyl-L-alanine amidase n=1 Tax=Desulfallas thermosapovorans DSM 6562 TaxID=1121431 RepID=A0A5S4ZR61_9FIRM|nr:N-acetylmuramoyl-L-alanine amidase [Desulfallas thermosapovorans DSM 6562]